MENKLLNADISEAISGLQASMKEFLLKRKLYRLLLRGKGLEFETYRQFTPEDDASSIDWKASARSNSLLVKQYREERNLKVIFLIDVGDNMVFGSTNKLKCEYAAEVAAAFSHLIISSGDRPGFIFFSDEVTEYIKPAGGEKHFNIFVDYVTDIKNYHSFSNLKKALDFTSEYIKKDVESVIILSDFLSFDQETSTSLSLVARKFETTALMIRDPLDNALPEVSSEIVMEDPRTGQQLLVNPKVAKEAYELNVAKQREAIRDSCISNNIDLLELETNQPFVPTLSNFLRSRIKQKQSIAT